MIKKSNFRNLAILFMAIGLFVSFVGCTDKNDGGPLKQEVATVKSDLQAKSAAVSAQIKALQTDLNTAKKNLKALEGKEGVTEKDLSDLETKIINKVVTLESFKTYKTKIEELEKSLANNTSEKELTTIKDQINGDNGILKRVTALETILDKKTQAKLKDLEGVDLNLVKEYLTKIEKNKGDIENLLKDYKETTKGYKSLNERFSKLTSSLGLNLLNSRVTSLVFKPEYVSWTGALPIAPYTVLDTELTDKKCGDREVSAPIMLQYYVNPSTVTKSDIKEVSFVYNQPKIMYKDEMPSFTGKVVDVKDGLLTVAVSVRNFDKLPPIDDDDVVGEIILKATVDAGEGKTAEVTSDWVRVVYGQSTSNVLVNKMDKEGKYETGFEYLIKTSVNDAKYDTSNETVYNMKYDEELNLKDVVRTVFASNKMTFDEESYGLNFQFDLNDEKGKAIKYLRGGNKTDQQEFITLIKGNTVAKTRIYNASSNKGAIGRTPIVHVMLKKGDCLVKEGWVKLNIVANQDKDEVVYDSNKVSITCDVNQEVARIGTKQMNLDFYRKYNIPKEDFHNTYSFDNVDGGVGTITQVRDSNDPTSYNLVYSVTEADLKAVMADAKNKDKVITKSATYTSTDRVITVTFKAQIDNSIMLKTLPDFFDANGKFARLNVAVPEVGDNDENNCTFAPNLNNSFESKDEKLNLNIYAPKSNKDMYDDFEYEYVFVPTKEQTQPKDIKADGVSSADKKRLAKIEISVSDDGKELYAKEGNGTKETVAKINKQSNGDFIEYQENDLAKYLLNVSPEFMRARLQIKVKNDCDVPFKVNVKGLADTDKFDVHFLRPINADKKSSKGFVDGVNFGEEGSWIDILKVVNLYDWRNYVKPTNKYSFDNYSNFFGYYGVDKVRVDKENIKYVGSNGKVTDLPSTIKVNQTDDNESFAQVNPDGTPKKDKKGNNLPNLIFKFGRLTYKNNGTNLNNDVTLKVPVTVTYKWGVVETVIDVPVKATDKNAKRK